MTPDLGNLSLNYVIELLGKDGKWRSIDNTELEGAITVDQQDKAIPELTFTLKNDDDQVPYYCDIGEDPSKLITTIINTKVRLSAGYAGADMVRLFTGKIYKPVPSFNDDGTIRMTISAKGKLQKLHTLPRIEQYPVSRRLDRPTKDSYGNKSLNVDEVDKKRNWCVRKVGQSINLEEVIRGIIGDYSHEDIIPGNILVDTKERPVPSWDGKRSILYQESLTDWQFLNHLANTYNAKIWIDETDDGKSKLNFVFREKIGDEITSTEEVDPQTKLVVKGIHFYFHRGHNTKPHHIAPVNLYKPWSPNSYQPIVNIQYPFDSTRFTGGVSSVTNQNGKLLIKAYTPDSNGQITQKIYTIKKEMLSSPEADKFLENFQLGRTTWEETKQFWNIATEIKDNDDHIKSVPPADDVAHLTFTTLFNPYIVSYRTYYVYNLGMGREKGTDLDRIPIYTVGYKITLNSGDPTTDVEAKII